MFSTTRLIHGLCALLTIQFRSAFALPAANSDFLENGFTLDVRSPRSTEDSIAQIQSRATKPFYAIAHRVLTVQGVKNAFSHGANAVEIDFQPWSKSGWWADHDGTDTSAGGTAREVLQAVADQRRVGKPVTFVWFDIKNADWCNADDPQWVHCSVTALRDLAREILQPVGVRALYGFYGTTYKYNTYSRIANNLNSNEAVNLDGNLPWAQQSFDSSGPGDNSRRVYSWGSPTIKDGFADRVANLKEAASSGNFAKVFSWTTSSGDSAYVKQLVDSIKVDGIIYGYSGANYDNGATVQTALKDVTNAVNAASGQYYLATTGDTPW
ncbi:hypothetical protein J7T55_011021 [Diaporthe amygdali]|uniref:uncharacterized protein n=1 Tax=Phomopsis amygdali TaxID=1214568 RepID=UPI0022FED722|nr:uncharacterized protein J7T55_011021 [Diaporthe amygdali]KAJ0106926.1 hypothetical protein J7T55_011021 [Diaporthe amygdali]